MLNNNVQQRKSLLMLYPKDSMQNLISELEYLGLTTNEAKIYLSLSNIGPSSAGRIAKECQIERTSTYNSLQRLIKSGLISQIFENNKKLFSAVEPSKIASSFKEKEQRALLLASKITKIKKNNEEEGKITRFTGNSGVKNVLNDILTTCKKEDEYLVIGLNGEMSQRLDNFTKIYVARKDEKKLRARALVKKTNKGHKMSKFTKVRYLPDNISSHSSISIYQDKVSIITWSANPESIIIENKKTADSFRSYFEYMWENAKSTN